MPNELLERVAVLENKLETINGCVACILTDGRETRAAVTEIKLLIAEGKGAWWAGRLLGAVIVTLWTALIASVTSLWMTWGVKLH